jgi:hypothetical protein
MTPINNSDTAWLITADFNQDNSLHYLDLIEDIYCPSINDWVFETLGTYDKTVGTPTSVGTPFPQSSWRNGVGASPDFNDMAPNVGGFYRQTNDPIQDFNAEKRSKNVGGN